METIMTEDSETTHTPAFGTIAERIEMGRTQDSPVNGGIVPFPSQMAGQNIVRAPSGGALRSIERMLAGGFIATAYEYKSSSGETIQAVLRFDHPTESKEIRPIVYFGRSKGGGDVYVIGSIKGQRPLYGLDQLAARPDARVLVVEGEKTADAAAKLFPDLVVITWMSGANSVHRAEMVPLEGRSIILWPDNDAPGRSAMRKFAAFAYKAGAKSIALVDVPTEFGEKWDLADDLPAEYGDEFPIRTLIETARIVAPGEVARLAEDTATLAEPSRLLGHLPGYSAVKIDQTETALSQLNPDMQRAPWVRIARCIYYGYGDTGLELFDRWSKGSTVKYRAGEPKKLWAQFAAQENFRADSLAWLFRRAQKAIEERNNSDVRHDKSNVELDVAAIWRASIEELNESHAVVNRGGKTAVLWENFDPRFGRFAQKYLSKRDFLDRYVRSIAVPQNDDEQRGKKERRSSQGAVWFNSTLRRTFDDVVFAPGREFGPRYLNLWQGFSVEPADNNEGWSRLKQHLLDHVANGEEQSYEYLLNWLAFAVQCLDQPVGTALILLGKKGAGKSIITDLFGRLFGQHTFVTSRMDDVLGRFNDRLETTSLLGLEEAIAPGNRSADGVLKDLLTRKTLRLEGKFFGVWDAPNYLRIIITSNNEHVVRADGQERRYAVFEVTNPHQTDPIARRLYFGLMVEQMENGGYAAMLGELQNRDISRWNAEAIPETAALKRQKQLSLSNDPVQMYLSERLMDGVQITGDEASDLPIYEWSRTDTVMVPANVLAADFHSYVERNGLKATDRQLSLNLPKYMPEGFAAKVQRGRRGDQLNKPYKAYPFPPLEEARRFFEKATGLEIPREPEE